MRLIPTRQKRMYVEDDGIVINELIKKCRVLFVMCEFTVKRAKGYVRTVHMSFDLLGI